MSPWSEWGACSVDCGGGAQTRARDVLVPASNGGTECPTLNESRVCNQQACTGTPVDCVASQWGAWSACVVGSTQQTRSRAVITPSANGGTPCPTQLTQTRSSVCSVDCTVAQWSDWSQCSEPCGGGSQTRNRTVTRHAANGGAGCPSTDEARSCNDAACTGADCVMSEWGAWGSCSASCGGGTRIRGRAVEVAGWGTGVACGGVVEVEACNTAACVTGCTGCWAGTSGVCMASTSECFPVTQDGECPGASSPCASTTTVNCVPGQWSSWSACNAACGGGSTTRTRGVVTPSVNGGGDCPLYQTVTCNAAPCSTDPIDCSVSVWGDWGACSATCGGGTQSRSRSVTVQRANGGQSCPSLVETRACNEDQCPGPNVDCQVTDWTAWSECVPNSAMQTRNRTVVTPTANGGAACPSPLSQTRSSVCGVDCEPTEWGEWGTCSAVCGGGLQSRTRGIASEAQNGGATCDALSESRSCNDSPCPAECSSCWPGTAGPCHDSYMCYYLDDTGACPTGSQLCDSGTAWNDVMGGIAQVELLLELSAGIKAGDVLGSPWEFQLRVLLAQLLAGDGAVTPSHVVINTVAATNATRRRRLATADNELALLDCEFIATQEIEGGGGSGDSSLARAATPTPTAMVEALAQASQSGQLSQQLHRTGLIASDNATGAEVVRAVAISQGVAPGDDDTSSSDVGSDGGGTAAVTTDSSPSGAIIVVVVCFALAVAAAVYVVWRRRHRHAAQPTPPPSPSPTVQRTAVTTLPHPAALPTPPKELTKDDAAKAAPPPVPQGPTMGVVAAPVAMPALSQAGPVLMPATAVHPSAPVVPGSFWIPDPRMTAVTAPGTAANGTGTDGSQLTMLPSAGDSTGPEVVWKYAPGMVSASSGQSLVVGGAAAPAFTVPHPQPTPTLHLAQPAAAVQHRALEVPTTSEAVAVPSYVGTPRGAAAAAAAAAAGGVDLRRQALQPLPLQRAALTRMAVSGEAHLGGVRQDGTTTTEPTDSAAMSDAEPASGLGLRTATLPPIVASSRQRLHVADTGTPVAVDSFFYIPADSTRGIAPTATTNEGNGSES